MVYSLKKILFFTIALSMVLLFLSYLIIHETEYNSIFQTDSVRKSSKGDDSYMQDETRSVIKPRTTKKASRNDYFTNDKSKKETYSRKNQKCKIPKVDPWHKANMKFFGREPVSSCKMDKLASVSKGVLGLS